MKKFVVILLLSWPSANIVAQHEAPANTVAQHQPPQQARDELNAGVKAYREAHYESAIEHFQRAIAFDSDYCVARLYLATTLAMQYVPGVETDDNIAYAKKAMEQYQMVLTCMPSQTITALKGMAFLKMNMKQFAEAGDLYRQALKQDEKDPELYYSVGVIDWMQAYKNSADEKAPLGLKVDEPLIHDPACAALRQRNLALVEDGIQMLTQAMQLRQDYDDAMVYTNLLYRRRADMQCDDPAAAKVDEKKADDWSIMAMQARKKKADAAKKCAGDKAGCSQ